GTCSVTATKAADDNYLSATSDPQNITISKASQAALSMSSKSSGTYGEAFLLTTTGGSGGGLVTFVVSGTACAQGTGTDAGKLLIASGTGTCSVTATKAADNNYLSATSDPQNITISKATQPALTVTTSATGG